MSYCRFSSNDWQCDVYAYEDASGGYTVHVAGRRHVFGGVPAPIDPITSENIEVFIERELQMNQLLEKAYLQPIGLSRDGQQFNVGTVGECADLLEDLRREGYLVPQRAIDMLRREEKEQDDETNQGR